MSNGLRLAELLAVRLCHDLSGPLNAMLGVSEAATDDPTLVQEVMPIIAEAAQMMAKRLRLLRAAWGGAAPLSVVEFSVMASGLVTKRVAVSTEDLDPGRAFAAEGARVALNALLLAVGAVQGNGLVTVGGDAAGDVMFRIEGPRAAWPPGFIGLLADPDTAWDMVDDPGKLQVPLTVLLAQAAGARLSLLLGARQEAAAPLMVNLSGAG